MGALSFIESTFLRNGWERSPWFARRFGRIALIRGSRKTRSGAFCATSGEPAKPHRTKLNARHEKTRSTTIRTPSRARPSQRLAGHALPGGNPARAWLGDLGFRRAD